MNMQSTRYPADIAPGKRCVSDRILGGRSRIAYFISIMSIFPVLSARVRFAFCMLALVSFGLFLSGVMLDDLLRLPPPCSLCILQRFIYLLFCFWSVCGAIVPGARRFWCFLLALTAAGGMGAAGWQSWMEYAPDRVSECGFGEPALYEQLVNWLSAQWPSLFMVTGFCTQQDWHFLGLSLANWSVLFFLGLLSAATGLCFWRMLKPR